MKPEENQRYEPTNSNKLYVNLVIYFNIFIYFLKCVFVGWNEVQHLYLPFIFLKIVKLTNNMIKTCSDCGGLVSNIFKAGLSEGSHTGSNITAHFSSL